MRSQLKLTDLDLDGACADAKKGLTLLKQPYNDTLLFYCNHRDYPTYFTLGIEFEQKQLFEAAAKAYSKCLDLRPDSAQMYVSRGAMYQNLRMYDKAEADYLKAESKGIKNELLYYNWALMKLVQEDYKKAFDNFDKVVKFTPKESQTAALYFQRGYCASKLANYDLAMSDYTSAIKMDSAQYAAFGHRSYLKFVKKQYADAKADAQKSLDIYPDYAYGHLMRGKIRHEMKEPEACEELQLAHDGGSPEAAALLKEICGKDVAPLPKN